MRFVPAIVVLAVLGVTWLLWRNHVSLAALQGVGEGVRSYVTAPQTVRIQEWLVEPYTIVAAGTPLVVVTPVDARADFDLLRSLYEMARVRSESSLAEDNAMSFERIRVEMLKTKSELAIARVKLGQAERDVARNAPLHKEKLVSDDIYELSVNVRDALQAEVEEKAKAIAQIESRLERLSPIGDPDAVHQAATVAADEEWLTRLETAQSAAAKNLEPLTLVAPIDGMVTVPQRQAGEFVLPGEPLLSINSLRSDRVVAYLRQPYRLDPKVGMPVQITTRTRTRQVFSSHVAQVGAHMEILTNVIAFIRPGSLVDAGLPIIVPVPDGIQIRPGEIVDVMVTGSSKEPPLSAPSAQTTVPPSSPRL